MHDPCTMAFDIKNIVTIWHRDPEKDGSDDSCGWFMRARHCDQKKLDEIAKRFVFEWKEGVPCGWFAENGEPNYSPQAITIGMFLIAANIHYGHWSKKSKQFLRDHAFEILHFAENNCDSFYTFITQPWGMSKDSVEERAREAACIVYPWILRAERPWWKHPRWHFWHWRIQFHPWQNLKRRWWDKCCVCGKRGFKGAAIGSWDGDKIWHSECDAQMRANVEPSTKGN